MHEDATGWPESGHAQKIIATAETMNPAAWKGWITSKLLIPEPTEREVEALLYERFETDSGRLFMQTYIRHLFEMYPNFPSVVALQQKNLLPD